MMNEMTCKCHGYGYYVDWELDKIVRCKECDDCIDKKNYGESKKQLDLWDRGKYDHTR
jgi:hypothetical protein